MLNGEFKSYLLAEIPPLRKHAGSPLFSLRLRLIRWLGPSYDAVYMLRYMLYFSKSRSLIRRFNRIRYNLLLIRRYGIFCTVGSCSDIGKGIFFPHPHSIVIGAGVKLGENCTIYQNVTLGSIGGRDVQKAYPVVGDQCTFYAGCSVIGAVNIQNNTLVGANSVLRCDTESDSVYAGVPAKRIK